MSNNERTNYLGKLNKENIEENVRVMGWVKKHRNLGELIFMDVRDITGYSQVVITNTNEQLFDLAKGLRAETVISVEG